MSRDLKILVLLGSTALIIAGVLLIRAGLQAGSGPQVQSDATVAAQVFTYEGTHNVQLVEQLTDPTHQIVCTNTAGSVYVCTWPNPSGQTITATVLDDGHTISVTTP